MRNSAQIMKGIKYTRRLFCPEKPNIIKIKEYYDQVINIFACLIMIYNQKQLDRILALNMKVLHHPTSSPKFALLDFQFFDLYSSYWIENSSLIIKKIFFFPYK